jgi:hypothetical protein
MPAHPPALLLSRPAGAQVVMAIVGPVLAGAVAGILLVENKTAYLIVSIVAILGGIAAGYEHPNAGEGARRGFCGGLLFGVSILLAATLADRAAKADVPDPQWVLVVITIVLGVLFGAIGGAQRAKRAESPRDSVDG